MQGFSPHQPLNLVPLPTDFCPVASAQSFADHISDLHDKIKRKIIVSNDHYKMIADLHRGIKV